MNPFGVPVTAETLAAMQRYKGKTITREDLAREAMRFIHSEHKNTNALRYAAQLKADYGSGVSTLCLIYNASGGKLELVPDANIDWDGGRVYKVQPPQFFENGQWIAFLHVHPSDEFGSKGARVFRGQNLQGEYRDFMIAWATHWHIYNFNNAYTEVGEKDQFRENWDAIFEKLNNNAPKMTKDERDKYCSSVVSIGGYSTSEFIAVLKHKFGPLDPP